MNSPLFSIITVTLNPGKDDLLKTVNSVLQQDSSDWELIIKDGGSTDGSLEHLPNDHRIRIFNEKDTGIFDAMNQAMKHVSGEFICFLNAGDFFCDDRALSAVLEVHNDHMEADFLYGNVHKPYSRSGYELYPKHLSRFYLFKHMICHQAWFVRRSYCAKAGGYETTHPSGADRRCLLTMILKNHIAYQHVPNVLVTYQGGGVSQRPEIIKQADAWIDDLRRELFQGLEYRFFALVWTVRDGLKSLLYDRFLYKYWRKVQLRRTSP